MDTTKIYTRIFPFTFNYDDNSLEVTFSTGEKALRKDGFKSFYETLEISDDAIDFTRLNNGAPVLTDHENSVLRQIGVVERGWVSGLEGKAQLRMSQRPELSSFIQDIKDGIIRNVSVGYRVHLYREMGTEKNLPLYNAVKWEPVEISFVAVPTDSQAQTRKLENASTLPENNNMQEITNIDELVKAETIRVSEIASIGRKFNLDHSEVETFINNKMTVDSVRALVLDRMAEKTNVGIKPVELIADSKDKFIAGFEDAIMIRSGLKQDDTSNEYRGMTMIEFAKRSLENDGKRSFGDKMDIIGRAFTSTSDFPSVLGNIANKFAKKGYEEQATTWQEWANVVTVSDFKPQTFIALSEFGDLDEVRENGEYKYGKFADGKEVVSIGTFGKLFSISRQAIINDDTGAFTRTPLALGAAARRTVNKSVYTRLFASTAMNDGVQVFHTDHNNVGTGAISVASIDAGRVIMAKQKDLSGSAFLNIDPNILLVPKTIESTGKLLMTSPFDPASNKFQMPNVINGLCQVVSDPLLDINSTTAFYLISKQFDAFVVGFLEGNQTPRIESKDGWNVDGIEFKVSLDWGVGVIDHRPVYRSTGA